MPTTRVHGPPARCHAAWSGGKLRGDRLSPPGDRVDAGVGLWLGAARELGERPAAGDDQSFGVARALARAEVERVRRERPLEAKRLRDPDRRVGDGGESTLVDVPVPDGAA